MYNLVSFSGCLGWSLHVRGRLCSGKLFNQFFQLPSIILGLVLCLVSFFIVRFHWKLSFHDRMYPSSYVIQSWMFFSSAKVFFCVWFSVIILACCAGGGGGGVTRLGTAPGHALQKAGSPTPQLLRTLTWQFRCSVQKTLCWPESNVWNPLGGDRTELRHVAENGGGGGREAGGRVDRRTGGLATDTALQVPAPVVSVPDPWHFGVDSDPEADPYPAIFVIDLQDTNKK